MSHTSNIMEHPATPRLLSMRLRRACLSNVLPMQCILFLSSSLSFLPIVRRPTALTGFSDMFFSSFAGACQRSKRNVSPHRRMLFVTEVSLYRAPNDSHGKTLPAANGCVDVYPTSREDKKHAKRPLTSRGACVPQESERHNEPTEIPTILLTTRFPVPDGDFNLLFRITLAAVEDLFLSSSFAAIIPERGNTSSFGRGGATGGCLPKTLRNCSNCLRGTEHKCCRAP